MTSWITPKSLKLFKSDGIFQKIGCSERKAFLFYVFSFEPDPNRLHKFIRNEGNPSAVSMLAIWGDVPLVEQPEKGNTVFEWGVHVNVSHIQLTAYFRIHCRPMFQGRIASYGGKYVTLYEISIICKSHQIHVYTCFVSTFWPQIAY